MQDNRDVHSSLVRVVREGRLEETKELIDIHGLSYSRGWLRGYALLRDATKRNYKEMVKLLLKSGSKVNCKCYVPPFYTPLHFAVENKNIEIVKTLLKYGADIHARTRDGKTPRHFAISKNKIQIIELLLKHGARVDVGDNRNITPLHIAVQQGYIEYVKRFLAYGADVNCVCNTTYNNGYVPLHFAVEYGHGDIVTLLLNSHANINVTTEEGISPLHIAAIKGYIGIVEDLLNKGACVDLSTSKGAYTPLCFATKEGHEEIVKLLSRYGDQAYDQGKHGKPILHFALERRSSMIAENASDYQHDNNPPGHISSLETAVYGNGEEFENIVKIIVEQGLIFKAEDRNNSKLLHIAIKKGYTYSC